MIQQYWLLVTYLCSHFVKIIRMKSFVADDAGTYSQSIKPLRNLSLCALNFYDVNEIHSWEEAKQNKDYSH